MNSVFQFGDSGFSFVSSKYMPMQEFHTVYMKVAVTVNRQNLHERLVFKASMAYNDLV